MVCGGHLGGEQARAGLLSSGGSLPATSSTRLLRTVSNHETHHHAGLPAAACRQGEE